MVARRALNSRRTAFRKAAFNLTYLEATRLKIQISPASISSTACDRPSYGLLDCIQHPKILVYMSNGVKVIYSIFMLSLRYI